MHFVPYRSRSELHKHPAGAAQAGAEITFRVILPRHMQCRGLRLQWGSFDGEEAQWAAFFWEGMEGAWEEWWQCRWRAPGPGLYRYRFVYDSDWGGGVIGDEGGGVGCIGQGAHWRLTVYDPGMTLPGWVPGGVLYQIFPDRFCASGETKGALPPGRILREDWGGAPQWNPDEQGHITQYDFFGGDLKGIAQQLDYLASLGVTCIYLNPIFLAQSNHRYDTADYLRIDPLLGERGDFCALCEAAHQREIRVILDGVFSHTGAESLYFRAAQQSQASPHYAWYSFRTWPHDYACWWGMDMLPELREDHPAVLEFFTGEEGVVRQWLRAGADGWRLDVADELPDLFLERLFAAAVEENPAAYILGEVWEDASCKVSHGGRRRFLQGGQMHSVMNYPLANAILRFARQADAPQLAEVLLSQQEHYPPWAIDGLMNHIGTHDTPRALNRLAGDAAAQQRQDIRLTPAQQQKARRRLMLCAALQFTLPGNPCVYYGDEAGLQGAMDPFNRACYPWGQQDAELLAYYRSLGALRRQYKAFAGGGFRLLSAALGCVAYERSPKAPADPADPALVIIANANPHGIHYRLGLRDIFVEAESAVIFPATSDE